MLRPTKDLFISMRANNKRLVKLYSSSSGRQAGGQLTYFSDPRFVLFFIKDERNLTQCVKFHSKLNPGINLASIFVVLTLVLLHFDFFSLLIE